MSIIRAKGKSIQHNVLYTVITAILLSAIFLTMVGYLYNKAEDEAYELLYMQTKQVKDDLILQLKSDRENLETMASFAAKMYIEGRDYSLLFDSFKPIGMIENIGVLNPDNTFSTKAGTTDISDSISFESEKEKGAYISGRIHDITNTDYQLIRSAVPIIVNDNVVGILYGAIKPDKLGKRYSDMVAEINAQLFVYEKETGDILIDTIQDELGNISFLKDRNYNKGYSYEQFISTDKGFTAFESKFRDENLHLHYSTIDEFGWMIAMGRYDSQVLAGAHTRAMVFSFVYILMIGVILLYILILMANEKRIKAITECASNVRKELLETTDGHNNIQDGLVEICNFAKSRSAVFFDTNGEFYHYIRPEFEEVILSEQERIYFKTELFRYASEIHRSDNEGNDNAVDIMSIVPDKHMLKKNPEFYTFLTKHNIYEISLSAIINKSNHIAVLATINTKNGKATRLLAEKVSTCFSMALYSKNYLNKTILSATTDSLTGVLNRVAYKTDIVEFDEEKPADFACVYIDVNELHLCNNKYGHAAGDEMLLYIANTLKEVFFGHKVYRMGGDEFLVFCEGVTQEEVKKNIEYFEEQLKPRNYHVALGISYRTRNINTEEMVREAEVRMYESKAEYYQNKQSEKKSGDGKDEYVMIKTGILEIDAILSILNENYNGIYRVSLDTDKARRILMPAYLKYNENEEHYSALFSRYVSEEVDPDYHRSLMSFLNYDALKRQLFEGKVPKILYKKTNGETVTLSVHKLGDETDIGCDVLWVFSKN